MNNFVGAEQSKLQNSHSIEQESQIHDFKHGDNVLRFDFLSSLDLSLVNNID